MLLLDVGCGSAKHKGCIGVDLRRRKPVDVIADASSLPFKTDCFDGIFLVHSVEHVLDITSFMKEVWRVSRNGTKIYILTPHFTSHFSYTDPTHMHHLTIESFDYFDRTTMLGREFRLSDDFEFRIKDKRITFTKRMYWNYLVERFANKHPLLYERMFGWTFSADDLYFELEAIKPCQRIDR